MPLNWAFGPAARFVRVWYTDPYCFDEWRAMIEEFRRLPGLPFQRDIGVLIDWTAIGAPSDEYLEHVSSYVDAFPLMLKGRRIALVVRDEFGARVAWKQAECYEDAGAVAAVFRSRADAEAWLCDLTSHDLK